MPVLGNSADVLDPLCLVWGYPQDVVTPEAILLLLLQGLEYRFVLQYFLSQLGVISRTGSPGRQYVVDSTPLNGRACMRAEPGYRDLVGRGQFQNGPPEGLGGQKGARKLAVTPLSCNGRDGWDQCRPCRLHL